MTKRRLRPQPYLSRVTRLKSPPPPLHQPLNRPKRRLVSPLPARGDPVPQVEVRQPRLAASLDLPEDAVRAVARAGEIRLEERVDGREPVGQPVHEAHHPQDPALPKLDEFGVDVA